MKLNVQQIKSSLISKFVFLTRFGHDPYFDWTVSLFVSIIIAVVFSTIGYTMFTQTFTVGDKEVLNLSVSRKAFFDQKELKKVLNSYDDRESQRKVIEAGYSGPNDPSF